MKKFFKKLLIKSTAILCSAMLLFLSPYAGYIDVYSIQTVYASDWAIGGGVAVDAILKFLIGLLGSVAAKKTYEAYEDEIYQSFYDYISFPDRLADLIGESAKDSCVRIYDKTSNTIHEFSWDDVLESLHEFHDDTVDDLTSIYVKYCPQLLDICYDFVGNVLSGDVVIPGLSTELIDDTFSDYESIQNADGTYHVSGYGRRGYLISDDYATDGVDFIYDDTVSIGRPYAVGNYTDGFTLYVYQSSSNYSNNLKIRYDMYRNGKLIHHNSSTNHIGSNWWVSFGINIPVFSSMDAAISAFETDDYSIALNHASSIDSAIESDDIPSFTKSWRQRELERLLNSVDVTGIGSYGRGISADNWINELPWIRLESLPEYALSLLDMYKQMINDILNGTYDSDKAIPETYSDAWDETLTDAWDNTVEQSTEVVPGEGEKDKPTDGDDKDKDDSEGGGGGGNSNNEDNNPDIKAIIDKIPDELKAYGKCDEFAQSLVEALEESGIAYKIIRVSSEALIYSDKFGSYIGVEYHYGVQVGDTVYDNLTTYGMLLDAWLKDLGLTQGNSDITWKYVFEIFNQ